jgi:hypothetical protein
MCQASLLAIEPDYLPDSKVCFSHAWTPFPNGGSGGIYPPQLSPIGSLEENLFEFFTFYMWLQPSKT